ncbi:MAG: phenylacetate--CoA ligase [Victivallaceae bacterium]
MADNALNKYDNNSEPDYMALETLHELQLTRLRNTVKLVYDKVELFRKRMDRLNLKPADIQSMADLAKLPFSEKNDLRDAYPFGLFASPMEEVVRLHASSGTTGKPIVVAYTQDDINIWAGVMKRTFACCGISSHDIIQNSYGYGLSTGGLGTHYGAEAMGATVVPTSGGNTQRQLAVMKDFGITAICCTPSYFNFLIEEAEKTGIDLRELPLRVGVFGSEPWTDQMRERIETASGIKAYDIYGLSEIIGPGVGVECEFQNGLHIFEDHFYPEIVNPDTGEVLPDGQTGELVLTTLTKQAMPMIRYRTRDITCIIPEPCACGRTIRRVRHISSRCDDRFVIRGVNVFPSQIEAALLSVEGTLPHYNIILYTENGMDNIEVDVEITEECFSDKVRVMEALMQRLVGAIEQTTGLRVFLKLVAPQTIQRSEGKTKRVIDRRVK